MNPNGDGEPKIRKIKEGDRFRANGAREVTGVIRAEKMKKSGSPKKGVRKGTV